MSKYMVNYKKDHYDQITIYLPKGTKEALKTQADSKGVSMNKYIAELIIGNQNDVFDRMQISKKNRSHIQTIIGNIRDGYTVTFIDGKQIQCENTIDIRRSIINYLRNV